MKEISGNKLFVKAMKEEGVEVIFGYPGGYAIDIFDELYRQDHTEIIVPRHALTAAGCQIIRCTVPTMEAAEALTEIKKQITIPLVADIHFDHKLAIEAIRHGADKIRINPGNIGNTDCVRDVVKAARERNIPIRIGVNSGSLEKQIVQRDHAMSIF